MKNTLPQLTDDAGTRNYFLTNFANTRYLFSRIFHHKLQPVLLYITKDKNYSISDKIVSIVRVVTLLPRT